MSNPFVGAMVPAMTLSVAPATPSVPQQPDDISLLLPVGEQSLDAIFTDAALPSELQNSRPATAARFC